MYLLIIVVAIALQIFLTSRKVSPFLSLLIVAIVAGLLLGMEPTAVLKSMEKGVASTMGGLALIICLGAILGKLLEASGAAEKIATTMIGNFGEKRIQWAILLTGFFIGIPLYYNAGFVILVPLVFSVAHRTKLPLLYIAIPMAASLSTTHCFLPPHPSPVLLSNAFGANMGKTLLYGLIVSVPAVIMAGPVLGKWLKNLRLPEQNTLFSSQEQRSTLPAAFPSFLIGLLPVVLIMLSVMANQFLSGGVLQRFFHFIGDPAIALLLAVLLAIYCFGVRKGVSMDQITKWVHDAIGNIAVILLIITAGGILKQVLQDSGVDKYIASFSTKWQMPPLLFAWAVTALLRITIGSATVAGITAAGIVYPLTLDSNVSPELMVLAVGTGSVFGSHINDSGFWMFKEFFQLSLKQTFLSWSIMETIISLVGLLGVLLLELVL